MRITIIGAGNMGAAIACGLAQSQFINAKDITVSNPHNEKLEKLKTMNNDRIKPLPPLNMHTLNAINKSCFFKFRRRYRVNRILQMRSRDVCRKIWQKYGCGEIYDRLPECCRGPFRHPKAPGSPAHCVPV